MFRSLNIQDWGRGNLLRWGRLLLFMLGIIGMFWIALELTWSQRGMKDSDFFSLWAAGKLVGSGMDPYNEVEWIQIHNNEGTIWISDPAFLYPLPVAILFIPLGYLSIPQASVIWLFLSQLMIIISIVLCCQTLKWDRWKYYLPVLLAGAALWRGVIVTIRNGQLGAFLLFCLSMSFFFGSRKKWYFSGLFIGFLFLKPPITGLFLILTSLWFFKGKKWKALTGIGTTMVCMLTIATILQPSWLVTWFGVGVRKLTSISTTFPTMWGLTANLLSNSSLWIWVSIGLSFLLLGIVSIALLRSNPEKELLILIPVTLSLTLFLAPYMWAYDLILLLLPVIVLIAKMDQLGLPFLLNANMLFLMDLLSLGFLYLATKAGNDTLSALLPLIIIGATCLVMVFESGKKARPRKILDTAQSFNKLLSSDGV